MRHKRSMGDYFARLASMCDVSTGQFIRSLLDSRENKNTICGTFSIECRKKTLTQNTFLIKHGLDVVAQFQVTTEFLQEADSKSLNFKYFPDKTKTSTATRSETPRSHCIRDLKAGMNRVNLKAKVLEITAPIHLNTRYRADATLAKALIGDETGRIQLCLWNEQAETVSVGETIKLENATASKFNDKTQLSLGAKGKIIKETPLPLITHLQCEMPAE